jgi:alpha-tubulin suppressor-like RCC1 family protein
MADSSVPVAVTGLGSGVAAIAAGVLHSCALTSGGGVQCWGANSDGELGDGSTLQSSVPVAVTGLGSGVAAIAAGGSHSCALATGGGVLCWGENLHGELGDGSRADRSVPVPVVDLASGVAALAANGEHTCALTTGGGALCWGDNLYGQLGDGHLTHSSVPIAVVGFPAPVPALGAPGLALLAAALLGAAVAVQRRRRLRCALPRATPSAARAD